MLKRNTLSAITLAAIFVLCGCVQTPPLPEIDWNSDTFPPLAAEYRTTLELITTGPRDRRDTTWRIWRDADRIVIENPGAMTGEIWQRDGAAIFHQKLFHEDRKSVEFHTDDLRMNGVPLSWARQNLLFDPSLLTRLTLKKSGWRDGYPFQRYVGEADGSKWDITIRTDLRLPISISQARQSVREHTELVTSHALSAALWSPLPVDDYERIDFADFGDRQSDPFIAKIQAQLGQPHTH